MYTLEITSAYNSNLYVEIKAETIEECFRIAHERGYTEKRHEFYCNGIKK